MILQNDVAKTLQSTFCCGKLGENITAIPVVIKHVFNAAKLTYYSVKPVMELAQSFCIAGRIFMAAADAIVAFNVHRIPPGGLFTETIIYPAGVFVNGDKRLFEPVNTYGKLFSIYKLQFAKRKVLDVKRQI